LVGENRTILKACQRQLGFLEFKHFQDKVDPGTWLKPGAWGCKRKERSDQKRRGVRPTFQGYAGTPSCSEASMAQNRRMGMQKERVQSPQGAEAAYGSFGAP